MKKIVAIMLSLVLLLAGVGMLYAKGGNYIQVYDDSISSCQRELLIYDLDIPSTPYTFNLKDVSSRLLCQEYVLIALLSRPLTLGDASIRFQITAAN